MGFRKAYYQEFSSAVRLRTLYFALIWDAGLLSTIRQKTYTLRLERVQNKSFLVSSLLSMTTVRVTTTRSCEWIYQHTVDLHTIEWPSLIYLFILFVQRSYPPSHIRSVPYEYIHIQGHSVARTSPTQGRSIRHFYETSNFTSFYTRIAAVSHVGVSVHLVIINVTVVVI